MAEHIGADEARRLLDGVQRRSPDDWSASDDQVTYEEGLWIIAECVDAEVAELIAAAPRLAAEVVRLNDLLREQAEQLDTLRNAAEDPDQLRDAAMGLEAYGFVQKARYLRRIADAVDALAAAAAVPQDPEEGRA